MLLKDLKRINVKSVRNAGPRYTPGQDPSAPNLEIKTLNQAVEGLIGGKPFKDRIISFRDVLEKSWAEAYRFVNSSHPRQLHKPLQLFNMLSKLSTCVPGHSRSLVNKAIKSVIQANEKIINLNKKLDDEEAKRLNELKNEGQEEKISNHYDFDSKLKNIHDKQRYVSRYERSLDDIKEFLYSPGCNLHYNNCLLFLGEWGTGKTHYLCDLAIQRMQLGRPALLILAKDFDPGENTGQSLAKYTGINNNFIRLIEKLNKLGKACGERALLIIDGINESDHDAWRRDIVSLNHIVKRYKYIGLILSCRQPFELLIIPDTVRNDFIKIIHRGFADIEFDAQTEFFKFYKIPLPEIPLLAEEFSRPLTLKIMCEAFAQLPKKKQRKGFAGIASGQRGMTYILETFINRRAENVERKLGLPKKYCWTLIKGDKKITNSLVSGIASNMSERLLDYIPKEMCMQIIQARPETKQLSRAKKLYRNLIAEGILLEYMEWRPEEKGGPFSVVRLPYQRFSDHIIARHFFQRYLETTSESTIRKSFYSRVPLGKFPWGSIPRRLRRNIYG